MPYYSQSPLTDAQMSRETNSTVVGYGTGASHERRIQGAGGEIGYDGFRDPRPGHEDSPIVADRVFIDEKTNEVKGANFRDRNGNYCCSYVGQNYADMKDSNRRDMDSKREQAQRQSQTQGQSKSGGQTDEFGVDLSRADHRGVDMNQSKNRGH